MLNQTDRSLHINPRYRAYGRARLDIAQRARTRQDWDLLWKRPQYSFPFVWGRHWRQCTEYRVDDFAAEVGFLIDVLGLPVNAFNASYAMFTSPDNEFYFAVVPISPETSSTPPDAIRIQFMVDDIFATTTELERRGIVFNSQPQPVAEGSLQWIASFSTPHGICMELWGMVEQAEELVEQDQPGEAVEPALDLELPLTELVGAEHPESVDDEYSPEVLIQHSEPSWRSRPVIDPGLDEDEDLQDLDDEQQEGWDAPVEPGQQRHAAPERPERLFKSGQEMLAHLQRQGKLSAALSQSSPPRAHSLQSPTFHPAPKPRQTEPKLPVDQAPDFTEQDESQPEPHHYKPITFHDES